MQGVKTPIINSADGLNLHKTTHVWSDSKLLKEISKYCLPLLSSPFTDLFNGSSTSIDIPFGNMIL